MGQLVFQATLGGQVNLVGPNTASTFNINVPAVAGNMVTTGDTGTVTNTMLASSAYTAPGTIGSGTPNTGAFTTLTTTSTINNLTVGRGAGSVATNTAVGVSALAANTTGLGNTSVGYAALDASTSSDYHTAVGWNALGSNTTGARNTAFGAAALATNSTGGFNVAMGVNAGYAITTGSYNVALGYDSLSSNTTASNNTAVGYQAGYSNTTAGVNVYVGYQSGYTNSLSQNNVFVGNQAGYTHNVASVANGFNTYIGAAAGYSATTGTNNTFIGSGPSGFGSGYYVTTGSKNTIIGGYNGNQGGLDIRTASNWIVLSDGDGNPRGRYDGADNSWVFPQMYVKTTASSANLFVDSDGYIRRSTSALKYKQDVRDLESMDISVLRPVRYKSKCEGDDQNKDNLGLIADEAAEAGFEELVVRGADGEVEGFQYERLTVVLLKELQVLKAKVAALENQA